MVAAAGGAGDDGAPPPVPTANSDLHPERSSSSEDEEEDLQSLNRVMRPPNSYIPARDLEQYRVVADCGANVGSGYGGTLYCKKLQIRVRLPGRVCDELRLVTVRISARSAQLNSSQAPSRLHESSNDSMSDVIPRGPMLEVACHPALSKHSIAYCPDVMSHACSTTLLAAHVGEEEFDSLRDEQRLIVGYHNFPAMFVQLLESCVSALPRAALPRSDPLMEPLGGTLSGAVFGPNHNLASGNSSIGPTNSAENALNPESLEGSDKRKTTLEGLSSSFHKLPSSSLTSSAAGGDAPSLAPFLICNSDTETCPVALRARPLSGENHRLESTEYIGRREFLHWNLGSPRATSLVVAVPKGSGVRAPWDADEPTKPITSGVLYIVERNNYKELVHLALKFEAAQPPELLRHISLRMNQHRVYSLALERELQGLDTHRRHWIGLCRELKNQCEKMIAKGAHRQQKYRKTLEAVNRRHTTTLAQKSAEFEETLRRERAAAAELRVTEATRLRQELAAAEISVQQKVLDLETRLARTTAELEHVQSSLEATEDMVRRKDTEIAELRQAALERIPLAEANALEDNLRSALNQSANEILRGNELIARLQSALRKERTKAAAVDPHLAAALTDAQQEIATLRSEVLELRRTKTAQLQTIHTLENQLTERTLESVLGLGANAPTHFKSVLQQRSASTSPLRTGTDTEVEPTKMQFLSQNERSNGSQVANSVCQYFGSSRSEVLHGDYPGHFTASSPSSLADTASRPKTHPLNESPSHLSSTMSAAPVLTGPLTAPTKMPLKRELSENRFHDSQENISPAPIKQVGWPSSTAKDRSPTNVTRQEGDPQERVQHHSRKSHEKKTLGDVNRTVSKGEKRSKSTAKSKCRKSDDRKLQGASSMAASDDVSASTNKDGIYLAMNSSISNPGELSFGRHLQKHGRGDPPIVDELPSTVGPSSQDLESLNYSLSTTGSASAAYQMVPRFGVPSPRQSEDSGSLGSYPNSSMKPKKLLSPGIDGKQKSGSARTRSNSQRLASLTSLLNSNNSTTADHQ